MSFPHIYPAPFTYNLPSLLNAYWALLDDTNCFILFISNILLFIPSYILPSLSTIFKLFPPLCINYAPVNTFFKL